MVWWQRIYKDIPTLLYEIVHAEQAKQYSLSKDCISTEDFEQVNWEAIDKAMKESQRMRRVFVSKQSSGMCGVGKFMVGWRERESPDCPRCGKFFEDAPHVWVCSGLDADKVWDTSLTRLEEWMSSVQTGPDAQTTILHYLKGWKYNNTQSIDLPTKIQDLALSQSKQGWSLFFEGYWIPQHWQDMQQNYYNYLQSRSSGKCWVISPMKEL